MVVQRRAHDEVIRTNGLGLDPWLIHCDLKRTLGLRWKWSLTGTHRYNVCINIRWRHKLAVNILSLRQRYMPHGDILSSKTTTNIWWVSQPAVSVTVPISSVAIIYSLYSIKGGEGVTPVGAVSRATALTLWLHLDYDCDRRLWIYSTYRSNPPF